MRPDFAKVIVERPRIGGKSGHGGRRANANPEDLPAKQGMRRAHRDRKSLNEHLGPLVRFIRSNCGRPWDKVHSEICKNIRLSNAVQRHVLEHVKWYVETNAFVGPDGKAWHMTGHGPSRIEAAGSFYQFYVHPTSGLLLEAPRRKYPDHAARRAAEFAARFRRLSPSKALVLHDGQWYEATLRPLDPTDELVQDAFLGSLGRARDLRDFYGDDVFAVRKRQISSREKRRHKVR